MVKTENKFAVRLKKDEDREAQDQDFVLPYICPILANAAQVKKKKKRRKVHTCKIVC